MKYHDKNVTVRPLLLTGLQLTRLRQTLRREAPSEAWVDAQIVSADATGGDGRAVTIRVHDRRIFPPGGRRHTAMRWCRSCGRWTPPANLHLVEYVDLPRTPAKSGPARSAMLICDDCRIADDDDVHHELHDAGLFLRPSSSRSVIGLAALIAVRQRGG